MSLKIAFLVYKPLKQKRKDNSFDGNSNIGANLIIDILNNSGHKVEFCDAATASNFEYVLVSLTSVYDTYAFYKTVARRNNWQYKKRKFKVIIGGFGVINIYFMRFVVDAAVFGRAENIIVPLIESNLEMQHESIMYLPDIYSVKINQAEKLYHSEKLNENIIGCPNKCKFCQYTWSRKYINEKSDYSVTANTKSSPELLLKDLIKVDKYQPRIVTAIDGFSERIRFKYGKKIKNDDIKTAIMHLGSFGKTAYVKLYNVGNFPTETEKDREELYQLFSDIKPESKVIVILHTTPFKPMSLTPLQYAPVTMTPSYSELSNTKGQIVEHDTLVFGHSAYNESPYSHLLWMIVERACEKTFALFEAICFSKSFKSSNNYNYMRKIRANFDITACLKEYNKEPFGFVESYIKNEKLYEIYCNTVTP